MAYYHKITLCVFFLFLSLAYLIEGNERGEEKEEKNGGKACPVGQTTFPSSGFIPSMSSLHCRIDQRAVDIYNHNVSKHFTTYQQQQRLLQNVIQNNILNNTAFRRQVQKELPHHLHTPFLLSKGSAGRVTVTGIPAAATTALGSSSFSPPLAVGKGGVVGDNNCDKDDEEFVDKFIKKQHFSDYTYVTLIADDGSFHLYNIPVGKYSVSVDYGNFIFPQYLLEVTPVPSSASSRRLKQNGKKGKKLEEENESEGNRTEGAVYAKMKLYINEGLVPKLIGIGEYEERVGGKKGKGYERGEEIGDENSEPENPESGNGDLEEEGEEEGEEEVEEEELPPTMNYGRRNYPCVIHPAAEFIFFPPRERFTIGTLLGNPMIIMMLVSVILMSLTKLAPKDQLNEDIRNLDKSIAGAKEALPLNKPPPSLK